MGLPVAPCRHCGRRWAVNSSWCQKCRKAAGKKLPQWEELAPRPRGRWQIQVK